MTLPRRSECVGCYAVRPAEPRDMDRLLVLLLALQDHLHESNPGLWQMSAQARQQLKSQLQSRLAAPRACALVAEHVEAGVVGVIFGRVTTSSRYVPSQAGVIDQAYVDGAHRRAGVGSRLVAELCRFFAAQGVEELTLRYVVGNREAAAFWESLGFEPRIMAVGASRLQVETMIAGHSKA